MEAPKITHLSLTEWFERIGYKNTVAFREEDNAKRYRLQDIKAITSMPTDELTRFTAQEVADRVPAFLEAIGAIGNGRCALRLVPLNPEHPKLRVWSVPTDEALRWFDAQTIRYEDYRAELMPRPLGHTWSSILVVNQHGMFGEMIADSHDKLTQGFSSDHAPITFAFDFTNWELSEDNEAALAHLKELANHLHITDPAQRKLLEEKLNATFANDYLCGYFETVCSPDFGTWFIDYNRLLGAMFDDVRIAVHKPGSALHGQTGSPGRSTGRAKVLRAENIEGATLNGGDILVMDVTTPECLPLMQCASAIVTQMGGILSHAAITSRELKKPCIIGIRDLFDRVNDGDLIRVDADLGVIEKLA